MDLAINVIDAFSDQTFKGNPAAVIIIDDWLSTTLMQSIATENNLSETAFVKKIEDQHYEIRWFSPITEINFFDILPQFRATRLHRGIPVTGVN